jgi:probable HAF family extracellular repeat protein
MRVFLIGLLATVLLQAAPVTVIDLGGLGGTATTGYSINNVGLITGWAQTSAGDSHAFTSTGSGSPTDLNPSTATESMAYGANGAGTVVGTSYVGGQGQATVWTSTGVQTLGAGSATAINSSGQIVGGNGQAFLDSNGTVQQLGTLTGGNWSSAYGINDSGEVVGYGNVTGGIFRGFAYMPGTGMVLLGTLGGNNSYATDVNNAGQIIGHASLASGFEHAFVTTVGGAMIDLGTLGGSSSYAYGINTLGAIVGYSWIAGDTSEHAFLYYHGKLTDLNSLLASNSGWTLNQAYGINDAGDIVGTGTFQGQTHGFLIDPVSLISADQVATPEPGTIGLMGAGLIALGVLGRRKRRTPGR